MRKASTKKITSSLRARLAQLEEVLRENNIELPPPTPAPTSSEPPRTAAPRHQDTSFSHDPAVTRSEPVTIAASSSHHSTAPQQGGDTTNFTSDSSPDNTSLPPTWSFFPENSIGAHDSPFAQNAAPSPSPFPTATCDFTSNQPVEEDDPDDISSLLSARMGSLRIAEDGQLRYYGPTSNLHVHGDGFHSVSLSHSTIRHVATEGSEVLRKLGLDTEVPLAVEMHLARLYFAWEDPAIHVVDEDTFFLEKERYCAGETTNPYYSETLNNAICAIGANLASGENLNLPEPVPEFFSARAKALLEIEMDSPTVATVQALVIMSASEAGYTRDARGWLYSGMAARLSADLGLHLDPTRHMKSGLLTQYDIDVRQTAFWGVFIQENMWSLYCGRSWGISGNDISAARPMSHQDEVKRKMWRPYPMNGNGLSMAKDGIFYPLEACTDANISLAQFMRKVNITLYSCRSMEFETLISFVKETRPELLGWLDSIHPSLRINASKPERPYVPAVLQLHMQYHATMVALCRPYLSTHLRRAGASHGTTEMNDALQDAADGCITSAHQIAETLRCYQRQHSIRRANIQIVHIIFTACLVFIYDVCTRPYAQARTSLSDLQFCCHCLGELGQSYGNAMRALEVIILVKSEWQRMASAKSVRPITMGTKRSSFTMSTSSNSFGFRDVGAERHKRRTRLPGSTIDPFDPPMFLTPSSFGANTFQMPSADFSQASPPNSLTGIPGAGDGMYDAWQLLQVDRADFGLADMSDPLGVLEDHTLHEILVSGGEDGSLGSKSQT